jgi:hypothetical protein
MTIMRATRRLAPCASGLSLVLSAAAFLPSAAAVAPGGESLLLADFRADTPTTFPSSWKTRADTAEASRVYTVVSGDGRQYLHAVADADSVQIGLPVSFHLREHPFLSWRWRVDELPSGADERSAATNDSAAGVYIVFPGSLGGLLPRAIKYVWSAREPRGTALASPHHSNTQIVVLESGGGERGIWRTETVNVPGDYRRLFKAEPPEPEGIALLTDADDTKSHAAADYDDFRALAASPAADGTAGGASQGGTQ